MLCLPVLGPSTVRDLTGSFVNLLGGDPYYNVSTHGNNEAYLSDSLYMKTKVMSGIDFRAKNLESIDKFRKKLYGLLCISEKFIYTR